MNTPIVDPMFIYLLQTIDTLKVVLVLLSFAGFCVLVVLFFVYRLKESEPLNEIQEKIKNTRLRFDWIKNYPSVYKKEIPEIKERLESYIKERESLIEPHPTRFRQSKKYLYCSFWVLALFILLFFIPSRNTLIAIYAAKQVTPHNLNVAGGVMDKTIDSIFEKVDQYLDKNEKE